MRRVWFHREYTRFQGGHLKHSHYFAHVGHMPGFVPRITFTGEPATETLARERLELWTPGDAGTAADWAPRPDDLLFVAGVDWRYPRRRLDACQTREQSDPACSAFHEGTTVRHLANQRTHLREPGSR